MNNIIFKNFNEELDTIRFGDVLEQFGGMENLNIFGMIDFMYQKYVGKKVIFYIKIDGEDQIRIRDVKKFTIEAHRIIINRKTYSFKFEFENSSRLLLISDDETRISLVKYNKN